MDISEHPLFKGLFLFEYDSGLKNLIKFEPYTFSQTSLDIITMNSFLDNSQLDQPIYSFTVDDIFCYAWNFNFQSNLYSIIILSPYRVPKLFYSFYESISSHYFENFSPQDILYCFYDIMAIITKWKLENDEIIAPFFGTTLKLKVPSSEIDLNPFFYFGSNFPIIEVWKKLVSYSPILIISNNPQELLDAAYSLQRLLHPLPIYDSIVISINHLDPRINNVFNNGGIVALSGNRLPIESFPFKLKTISTSGINSHSSNSLTPQEASFIKDVQARSQKIMSFFSILLDDKLLYDPYNDFILGDFIPDEFPPFVSGSTLEFLPPISDLAKYSKTKSIKDWRIKISCRDNFREALLSSYGESCFSTKTLDQLKMINDSFPVLFDYYKNDAHIISVLSKHKKDIAHLLSQQHAESNH